jgi:drug/metabolite transporter (DMT)-like permease
MAAASGITGMSWPAYAILGPILWAISIHCDKYLLDHTLRGVSAAILLVFTAGVEVIALAVIGLIDPAVLHVTPGSMLLMMLSGVLYMAAMLSYFYALQSGAPSVVSPFFQTAPVFGYALGYFFLGEQLSAAQFAGAALIICGAVFVSLNIGISFPWGMNYRVAALMLVSAFGMASSTLIFKISAIKADFWTSAFWMYAGGAVFATGLLANPRYRKQLLSFGRANSRKALAVCGLNEIVNLSGNLFSRFAALLAPISLVQAVTGTTPIFVLFFGVLLSLTWPTLTGERLSVRELLQKLIASGLVIAGLAIVALS